MEDPKPQEPPQEEPSVPLTVSVDTFFGENARIVKEIAAGAFVGAAKEGVRQKWQFKYLVEAQLLASGFKTRVALYADGEKGFRVAVRPKIDSRFRL